MRIAISAEGFLPKVDGVVHRTLTLLRHLTRLGDEVLVICPRAEGRAACPFPVVDVPSFSVPMYPEYRVGLPADLGFALVEPLRARHRVPKELRSCQCRRRLAWPLRSTYSNVSRRCPRPRA